MVKFGVTERGDGGLDQRWLNTKRSVDGIIVITKCPSRLVNIQLPDNVIVHCTITGFGATVLEPNVRPAEDEIAAYHTLCDRYGGQRIVLRIDPVIGDYFSVAEAIAEYARGRVRISFLDLYDHVRERFDHEGLMLPHNGCFHAPLAERRTMVKQLAEIVGEDNLEICAEPDISCSGCISAKDYVAIGLTPADVESRPAWQRSTCMCLAGKVELLKSKGRCAHQCLYCYWKDL
jgi:hypothetical protein